MVIPFAGDQFTQVSSDLAAAFAPGDALVVGQRDGTLFHIRAATRKAVSQCVDTAKSAFQNSLGASQAQRVRFFQGVAQRLSDDAVWDAIALANRCDVEAAVRKGRSTGRLVLLPQTRRDMIAGLDQWAQFTNQAEIGPIYKSTAEWGISALKAPVGIVGFVFEGRPNVLVDACGVLANGNVAVLRIGDDAAGTAQAILEQAIHPALIETGFPSGSVTLLPRLGREAAWALFTDRRLGLAIARGSGPAVRQLGDLATQSGIPVSLHGVGGAWMFADDSADARRFAAVVESSLDRKVCNTLNTCCIVRSRASDLIPLLIESLQKAAGRRGRSGRLHVLDDSAHYVPSALFELTTLVDRGGVDVSEPFASLLPVDRLSEEWEWGETPEITLVVIEDMEEGIDLFNRHSPKFVSSLISENLEVQADFLNRIDAPFVGDGFTRWVDGQYALGEPELGLANWEFGRPLGRASVLTGAGVHTIRLRMNQGQESLRR